MQKKNFMLKYCFKNKEKYSSTKVYQSLTPHGVHECHSNENIYIWNVKIKIQKSISAAEAKLLIVQCIFHNKKEPTDVLFLKAYLFENH